MIVCPTCATSYMVDPASLGPAGRTVRCTRCKHTWFAGGPQSQVAGFVADVIAEAEARDAPAKRRTLPAPDDFGAEPDVPASAAPADFSAEESIPAAEAPSLVPPSGEVAPEPRHESDSDDVETFAARRARLQTKRKAKRRSSKWTAVILVLFGFNVAVIGARNEVVRYLPQTASLFAAIGLPVNLRNLTFEDVKISKEERDGVAVLTVEGTIASLASKPVAVPHLRFAVRNAGGQEIYAWTAAPVKTIMDAGEKQQFRSRLASPPADASDVLVRFVNAHDSDAAVK
jgi:predicted Zn finger-like uncharacterized protein